MIFQIKPCESLLCKEQLKAKDIEIDRLKNDNKDLVKSYNYIVKQVKALKYLNAKEVEKILKSKQPQYKECPYCGYVNEHILKGAFVSGITMHIRKAHPEKYISKLDQICNLAIPDGEVIAEGYFDYSRGYVRLNGATGVYWFNKIWNLVCNKRKKNRRGKLIFIPISN